MRRTKAFTVDLPPSNFAVGLDDVEASFHCRHSSAKTYWFILTVRMVVLLPEPNEALESRGPFTNTVRHMAHKLYLLECAHTYTNTQAVHQRCTNQ